MLRFNVIVIIFTKLSGCPYCFNVTMRCPRLNRNMSTINVLKNEDGLIRKYC